MLLAPPIGLAQQTNGPPPPDQVITILNNSVGNQLQNPNFVGSIFWAIEQGNNAVAAPDINTVGLSISEGLLNASIVLDRELPAIDLSTVTTPSPRVDLDGTLAPAFQIRTTTDVPTDFVLLHVMNGRADLVDLDIAGSLVDGNGNKIPVTLIVDQDATLGFRYSNDFGLDENITGAGAIRIESEGVVTFAGTNDYTGGTRIVSGTLLGNDLSLRGNFEIDENARLDYQITDITQTAIFAGNIQGKGRLVKTGPGILSLSGGVSTHTGGTEISGGVLQATPDSLTGDVDIAQLAELSLSPSGVLPFAGAITGAGSVRKTGNTELMLTGANTFSGGLIIQAGELRGTTSSIPGNIVLLAVTPPDSTATVIIDQDFAGTHTGNITGNGVLRKEGSGRVLRQGTTTIDQTQIVAGTLAGDTLSLGRAIDVATAGAVVEFNLVDTQVFSGTVTGPGDLLKTGPGTLSLTTDQLHGGQTIVASGTLRLGAILGNFSRTLVLPGARLVNTTGQISGGLQNEGSVALGNSTATLPIGLNATLAAGSVLEITLDDAGNASRLDVGFTATLDAPSYALNLVPGNYATAIEYTVVTAGSIAPGSSPGQAFDDLAFIDVVAPPAFFNGDTEVRLTVQENFTNLGPLGTTPNQIATAIALEQVTNSGSPEARSIRDGLVPLRTAEIPPVLDMLAGETLSAFTNSRIANARYFGDSISRRLRASNFELTRASALGQGDIRLAAVGAPRARGGPGAWLEPFGIFSDNEGRGNASDITTRTYGVSGGVDYRLPERLPLKNSQYWRAGLGLGYTRHSLRNATSLMSGTGDSVQTAIYGGYRSPRFHAGAAARFAWTRMQSDRRIAFTSIDRQASANYDGLEWGGLFEVGGHFGDPKRALLHPVARFEYIRTTQDGFSESGAGDLSLAVPELSFDSLLLTLGARLSRVFTLDGEFGIEPELRASWTIDYGDRGRHVPATFYAVPGAVPFVTAGTEPDRNSISMGLGYVMSIAKIPLLSTHYDIQFGKYQTRHVLSAGLYFRW